MAIKKLIIIKSEGYDAHYNQAVEASLLDYAQDDTFILYLWANDNVVFVGKNQNAYLECNLDLLEKDGGVLARRITGGGAVYHDKGNVNYTFIAPKSHYDEQNQFNIVLSALNSLGFNAVLSGRNDMTIQGRKFSGNAFYKNNEVGLHHGTILIKSDYEKIGKYLSVSKIKLKAKGVESVASRIINLSEVKPVTKQEVFEALIGSFCKSVSAPVERIKPEEIDQKLFNKWHGFFCDKKRLYGDDIYYDARIEHRFIWGTADIRLKMDKNIIVKAKIYSDCLDTLLIEKKENALLGEDIYNIKSEESKDIIEIFKSGSGNE